MIACRFAAMLLAILFLFGATNSAKKLERMKATLVETHEWPQGVGLDCPPWPVPPFAVFCLQAGDTFYVPEYRPQSLPWATKGKKLMALVGSSLEIVLKGKQSSLSRPTSN